MIKSSEKTKSSGNLTFALDRYPKHDVRYDIAFFISLFNVKKNENYLKWLRFIFFSCNKQKSMSINSEDIIVSAFYNPMHVTERKKNSVWRKYLTETSKWG